MKRLPTPPRVNRKATRADHAVSRFSTVPVRRMAWACWAFVATLGCVLIGALTILLLEWT
jgi:hypothetical protein